MSHEDLADVKAIWSERVDPRYTLSLGVIGHHHPAVMDQDRPLGALVKATVDLLLTITVGETVIFEQPCPYDREALLASVRALAEHLAQR